MMATKYPTKEEVSEIFEIVDNEIYRKARRNSKGELRERKLIHNKANDGQGYCRVGFKGRLLRYQVIIWILHNGDIPYGKLVDHVDGNKLNNNINNLRLVSNRENQQNQQKHRDGHLFGCSYCKKAKRWRAYYQIKRKQYHIGYFDTELEAHQAYLNATKDLP